jgi:DNA-binding FadR family transcriptional regulator
MPSTAAQRAASGEGPASSSPPRKSKLAARIARAIEDDVIAADWPVGSTIGSEPQLIERYGVSRAVFREAVRLVEHHQVAVMRRGRSGGLKVIAPNAAAAVSAAVVYLEYAGTKVDDLLRVRSLLEPLAAAEAAKNVSEEDIAALRGAAGQQMVAAAAEGQVLAAYAGLHVTVAQLSGNPVLQLFVEVLAQLTDRYAKIRRTTKSDRDATAHEVDRAHRALVDAVVAGDAATAQHYMSAHLAAMDQWFADTGRRIITRRAMTASAHAAGGHKLAEVIAEEIRADIARGRWQVGDVIDSENGLLERYDVSRSAIREAVRLLEHHSIAWMRRGPNGGLIVARPDLDAGVEAMALYLDYRGATAADLLPVRKELELGCVDLVASRASEPEVRERLEKALTVTPDTPADEVSRLAHELHLAVAELAGNPVLVFLIRTMTSLWARHTADEPSIQLVPAEKPAEAVAHAHLAIVEAIASGDRGLARRRMARHLDAVSLWWH